MLAIEAGAKNPPNDDRIVCDFGQAANPLLSLLRRFPNGEYERVYEEVQIISKINERYMMI